MKKRDLIEFLSSTIESDAVVARLYNLFHKTYGYSLDLLNAIISFGVEHGIFIIGDLYDPQKNYNEIDWKEDNIQQEVFMPNSSEYIKLIFSTEPVIPKEFEQFLSN